MWLNGIIKGDHTKWEEQWAKERIIDIINISGLLGGADINDKEEENGQWAVQREQGWCRVTNTRRLEVFNKEEVSSFHWNQE